MLYAPPPLNSSGPEDVAHQPKDPQAHQSNSNARGAQTKAFSDSTRMEFVEIHKKAHSISSDESNTCNLVQGELHLPCRLN